MHGLTGISASSSHILQQPRRYLPLGNDATTPASCKACARASLMGAAPAPPECWPKEVAARCATRAARPGMTRELKCRAARTAARGAARSGTNSAGRGAASAMEVAARPCAESVGSYKFHFYHVLSIMYLVFDAADWHSGLSIAKRNICNSTSHLMDCLQPAECIAPLQWNIPACNILHPQLRNDSQSRF